MTKTKTMQTKDKISFSLVLTLLIQFAVLVAFGAKLDTRVHIIENNNEHNKEMAERLREVEVRINHIRDIMRRQERKLDRIIERRATSINYE